MINLLRFRFILAVICCLSLISACGQKGPLRFPEQPRPEKQKPGSSTSPQSFIYNLTHEQHT